jgi:N6-adenosine-specific RNA methylase IME4
MVNLVPVRKREHSRKPDEFYDLIEQCSPGPRLELFARHPRVNWQQWGDEFQLGSYVPMNGMTGQSEDAKQQLSLQSLVLPPRS